MRLGAIGACVVAVITLVPAAVGQAARAVDDTPIVHVGFTASLNAQTGELRMSWSRPKAPDGTPYTFLHVSLGTTLDSGGRIADGRYSETSSSFGSTATSGSIFKSDWSTAAANGGGTFYVAAVFQCPWDSSYDCLAPGATYGKYADSDAVKVTVSSSGGGTSTGGGTTQTVGAGDFAITVSPSSQTTTAGSSAVYTLTDTAGRGYTAPIGLDVTGLPAGADTSWPAWSDKVDITVTTAHSTPAGTYTLTITASGGGKSHSTTVTLVVNSSGGQTSSSATGRTATPKLAFTAPATLPGHAQVGEPFQYSFCNPAPPAGRLCGPPAITPTNPNGGTAPYTFRLKVGGGPAPPGLVLNTNTGWLRGTPTKHGASSFTVCAYGLDDPHAGVCRTTGLVVQPGTLPGAAFLGVWRGSYDATYQAVGKCPDVQVKGKIALAIASRGNGFKVGVNLEGADIRRDAQTCTVVQRSDKKATENVTFAGEQLQSDALVITLYLGNRIGGLIRSPLAAGSFQATRG